MALVVLIILITYNYKGSSSIFIYLYFSLQEQYELIYEVLSDFIDSFDTYANFRVVEDDL